jgi:hypothetical protein
LLLKFLNVDFFLLIVASNQIVKHLPPLARDPKKPNLQGGLERRFQTRAYAYVLIIGPGLRSEKNCELKELPEAIGSAAHEYDCLRLPSL